GAQDALPLPEPPQRRNPQRHLRGDDGAQEALPRRQRLHGRNPGLHHLAQAARGAARQEPLPGQHPGLRPEGPPALRRLPQPTLRPHPARPPPVQGRLVRRQHRSLRRAARRCVPSIGASRRLTRFRLIRQPEGPHDHRHRGGGVRRPPRHHRHNHRAPLPQQGQGRAGGRHRDTRRWRRHCRGQDAVHRRQVHQDRTGDADSEQHGVVAPVPSKRGGRRDGLVFLQEGRERFELEDLLRASAEVLGSGNFGSSYKATLVDGKPMVVKRFKEMNGAGRADFNEHMRRLGRLVHPNLLPVVAYLYKNYKKDEKLFVTEHMVNGGLAQILHGGATSSLPRLDWPARLKIIKGVARGLAYLYEELPMLTVPHGHLKSSNVLLNAELEPILSDYALVPVVTPSHASQVMVAYKAPECAAAGRASRKSDVWTLGILVLELLTGRFPTNYLQKGREGTTGLAGWVHSVVREEWTGEVFDKDMRDTRSAEGEMVKLLKVGLGCCDTDIAARWDIKEALAGIEEVRERDPADDSSTASSYLSDGAGAGAASDHPHSLST
uniref:Protein kinase domain-containing protein n=1 Tax=Aegilops tauschii subsp. strangulata TaxID=200361 RepID=A0A453T1A9_AEGTS